MAAEARKKMARLFAQKIKKYLEISLQTTYLGQFCLADKFLPFAFFLDQQDERTPGFHTVSLWLPELVTCTELVKQAVYQPAAVLQKVGVCRIANLGVTTCGVTLHRAAVVIAVLVGAFLLRLASVRFGQYQGQHVEEVLVKALADQNEQLWYEHGLFRELGKSKQILHVRALLDGLDGLLVTQILHMLHYDGTNNHAGGLVACSAMAVPQTLVVFFFDPGPGKAVGKLDPAVGLAQSRERLLEFKQVVDTVL